MQGIFLISTLVLLTNSIWCLPMPDSEPAIVEIIKDEVILPVVKVELKEPELVKVDVEPVQKVESTILDKEADIKETVLVKSDVQPEIIKVDIQSDTPVKEEKPIVALLEVDSQGHENESDRVARQFAFGGFGGGFGRYGGGFGRYGGGFGGGRYGGGFGRYGGGFGGGRYGHGRYSGFGRAPFYG